MKPLLFRLLLSFLLLTVTTGVAYSESLFEQQVINDFFSPQGVENRTTVYGGEMAIRFLQRPAVGEVLPAGVTTAIHLLYEDELQARYAVTVTLAEQSQEWYLFFVRSALGSKLAAVRTLQLPPYLLERQLPLLRKKTVRTAAEEAQLQNLLFLTMNTAELLQHFQEHRTTYEELATLSEGGKKDDATTAAKVARVAGVQPWQENPAATDIRLGAFLDVSVGLLHLPDKTVPPVPDPDGYFYLEAVAERWFLYKTVRPRMTVTAP